MTLSCIIRPYNLIQLPYFVPLFSHLKIENDNNILIRNISLKHFQHMITKHINMSYCHSNYIITMMIMVAKRCWSTEGCTEVFPEFLMYGEEAWIFLKTRNRLGRASNSLGPRPSELSPQDLIFRESGICLTELLIAHG